MVNGNSNGSGESWGDTGLGQFFQSETSASSHSSVISPGAASDRWSQSFDWSWEKSLGLGLPPIKSLEFVHWLIEVGFHPLLPVLSEMYVS